MELTVLVESTAGGYTARDPFGRTATGPTAAGAIAALRSALTADTGELVPVVIPADHPLLKWAGTWQGDPQLDDFRRAVEEHRRDRNADPDAL